MRHFANSNINNRYSPISLTSILRYSRDYSREKAPVYDQALTNQLDLTESEYRRRTSPTYDVNLSYDNRYKGEAEPFDDYSVTDSFKSAGYDGRRMGYYDDDSQYNSFRRGIERVAHPYEEEFTYGVERGPSRVRDGIREDVRIIEPRGSYNPETVPIPCHFIRVGDILILQGRPSQVIRVSVSPQTGQYRYLGVDLFSRHLQEESSFVSNPSPSVVVQTMLGPVYKTYRVLDLRDDGRIVAMTESGDVKQGLPVVTQGNLFRKISNVFADGRGSVRALVINDGGRELVVDYKVIHGSRL